MKTPRYKYYYSNKNGLIYRVRENTQIEYLLSATGTWHTSIDYEIVPPSFSPISPIAVHFFERDGGYRVHFRTYSYY